MSFEKISSKLFLDSIQVQSMNQLCAPLKKNYHINHVCFLRTYKDGTGFFLTTRPDLVTHYLDEKYDLLPTLSFDPETPQFVTLFPTTGRFSVLERVMRNEFNVKHLVDFYSNHDHYVDLFCFGSNQELPQAINTFLNHKEKFTQFTQKFKLDAASLVHSTHHRKIEFPKELCPSLPVLFKKKPSQSVFTKREQDCLSFLNLGLTAPEIATQLMISKRTVEHHLENIKSKLGVARKSQILTASKAL